MNVVVDASAWYLNVVEPSTDARAALARDVLPEVEGRHDVVAPTILGYELAHLVHVKHRHLGGSLPARRERLVRLLSPIRLEPSSWHAVGDLAEAHDLSAYDAAYLELADRLGAALLTEDEKLRGAAMKALGKKRAWDLKEAERIVGE